MVRKYLSELSFTLIVCYRFLILMIASRLLACKLSQRVRVLHMVVMATVVMRRVRNPACSAARAFGKGRYING